MTKHYAMLPTTRVFLGDILEKKYGDDLLIKVLRAVTDVLKLLGYDRGHTSDYDGVTPDLTGKEVALWAQAASVLVEDPEAMKSALEAVSVRTLGAAYSTEGKARLIDASASKAFAQLRMMIRAAGDPLVGTRDNLDHDTLP